MLQVGDDQQSTVFIQKETFCNKTEKDIETFEAALEKQSHQSMRTVME